MCPNGEPLFCEEGITITIQDESAGEFLNIKTQCDRTGDEAKNSILINPKEWPALRRAIIHMIREFDKHEPITP